MNPRISLTGNIYCLGKGLEERFDYVVWFIPIEQFQMQIAPGFIGKALKKLPRQTEPKGAGHVLPLFGPADCLEGEVIQAPPDQV